MSIVRAVDVGFGNTKFVVLSQNKSIDCSSFPSIAPQIGRASDLSAGLLGTRNTVKIEVDGVFYEVGPDSRFAQDANYRRTLDPDFCKTPGYMALLRGALYYMAQPVIDLLVLGLPVQIYTSHKDDLKARVEGEHAIPTSSGEMSKVIVREVRVIPQPIGGFLDYTLRPRGAYQQMRNQMNLIIDPGFFTLDWVVSEGVKMMDSRSGSIEGGMSSVISTIAEQIGKEIRIQIDDHHPIDEALRNGKKPRFFGKEHDITPYIKVAHEKTRQFVAALANRVGKQGMDIDNIVIVGGGANFFKPVIQEKFGNHNIEVSESSVFANVRGFQMVGERYKA